MFSVTSDMVKWNTDGEYETQEEAEAVALTGSIDDSIWAVMNNDTEDCEALAWEGCLYRRVTFWHRHNGNIGIGGFSAGKGKGIASRA